MTKRMILACGLAAALGVPAGDAEAGLWGKALKEAGEFAAKKLGRKAGREGTGAVTGWGARQAARHADDLLPPLRLHAGHAAGPVASGGGLDATLTTLGKHKGTVAMGAGLAAFLRDPTPFLDAGGKAMQPVAEATGAAIEGTAHALAWPLAGLASCGVGWLAFWLYKRGRGPTPLPPSRGGWPPKG